MSHASSTAARSHLMIPDLQVRPGCPTQHLDWIGHYIVDRKPDVVVQIGDLWDMASLSHYEKRGSRSMEGKRYVADVACGHDAAAQLRDPARSARLKTRFVFTRGNHEQRIVLAIEDDPRLEGAIGLKDIALPDWEEHGYLDPVWIDGVCYSHYFYNPMTSRPWTGTVDNRLKQVGHSFTMGHQQTLLYGVRFVAGRSQHGLVCGAAYLHDESYKGPQGNAHWRGVVVKHQVRDGSYDPMFVSLDYLCRRYEGMSLDRFKKLNKIRSSA